MKESPLTTLIIGDIHFHEKKPLEGDEYIDKIINIASHHKPTIIVLLGDILDKHSIVHVHAHKQADKLIDALSQISLVYVLMGNHDLINREQFLTDNHIFITMRKWPNVVIVDKATVLDIKERSFVFVPYVPPGRFVEALNTLVKDDYTWELSDCIFAHQEIRKCKKAKGIISNIGDEWDENYPIVISGHEHEPHCVGKNVYYPGASSIMAFEGDIEGQMQPKKVWLVNWDEYRDDDKFISCVKKIDIGIKAKKILNLTIDEINNYGTKKVLNMINNNEYQNAVIVNCHNTQAHAFRKGKIYSELSLQKVKVQCKTK